MNTHMRILSLVVLCLVCLCGHLSPSNKGSILGMRIFCYASSGDYFTLRGDHRLGKSFSIYSTIMWTRSCLIRLRNSTPNSTL
ncbi:hypothetical protein EI94DRAFT_674003 [Lactarius quietus]|nr:hypothetical protein EI94DRAFT_674003 [Lactarius quietus]